MTTAYEAANYLVFLAGGICEDLTNMKLNKLLYYAQGHYLKKTGGVLFSDKIEAWEHGPVVFDVYQRYKKYGDSPITVWDDGLLDHVSEDEQDCLMEIAREYSRYTASALRYMTHKQNSPWDKVYECGKQHIEIPISMIKEYFSKEIKDIPPVEIDISDDSFIGYRDKDGYLVLPGDWDDEAV